MDSSESYCDLIRDSDGYTAKRLIAAYEELDPDSRVKLLEAQEFEGWVKTAFPTQLKYTTQILALIQHDESRKLAFDYCSTRYGEGLFRRMS